MSKCRIGQTKDAARAHLCIRLHPPPPAPTPPPPRPPRPPGRHSPDSNLMDNRIIASLAGGLEWETAARAPSYIALELDGSKTTNGVELVGAAGPYVVQLTGLDDSDALQSKTSYVACGSDSCYFSSTTMFTLKPSTECVIVAPLRTRSKLAPRQRIPL